MILLQGDLQFEVMPLAWPLTYTMLCYALLIGSDRRSVMG